MELVRELFVTAGFALIFSFIIAKLVSMAMAADSKPALEADDETIAAEVKTGEKLEVRGSLSETRVQSVDEAAEFVENLGEKPAQVDEALESGFGSREDQLEVKSAVKSVNIVEEKAESGGIEEVMEELKDQIDFVAESQETGAGDQPEGLVSLVKEEEKPVSDDDDWEGIERNELEKEFAAAVKFVESQGNEESLGNDLLMELYGLHKIATEGPCRESQPMALKVSARTKWNAWQRLGNMNPEEAMEQYISLLSDKVPRWTGGRLSEGEDKPEYSEESGHSGSKSTELISAANDATVGSEFEDQVKG